MSLSLSLLYVCVTVLCVCDCAVCDCVCSYLPRAHTCFFSLELPKYSSKAILRAKLLTGIHGGVV